MGGQNRVYQIVCNLLFYVGACGSSAEDGEQLLPGHPALAKLQQQGIATAAVLQLVLEVMGLAVAAGWYDTAGCCSELLYKLALAARPGECVVFVGARGGLLSGSSYGYFWTAS